MHKEFAARGLHIWSFERQGSTAADICRVIDNNGGATYSVSAGGGYTGGRGIPESWIVGVDGTIVFAGNPHDPEFDKVLKAEVAKVRYPGLGKLTVHSDVDRAAKAFITGNLDDARSKAQDVLADTKASDEAKADATFVAEKVKARYEARLKQARDLESKSRYVEAKIHWEWIMTAFGTRSEEGKAAKDRLAEYKTDKEIRETVKVEEELAKLKLKLESMASAPADRRVKEVEKFEKKYEGSPVAARARTELAALLR